MGGGAWIRKSCNQHRSYFFIFPKGFAKFVCKWSTIFETFATLLSYLVDTNHSHLHQLWTHTSNHLLSSKEVSSISRIWKWGYIFISKQLIEALKMKMYIKQSFAKCINPLEALINSYVDLDAKSFPFVVTSKSLVKVVIRLKV